MRDLLGQVISLLCRTYNCIYGLKFLVDTFCLLTLPVVWTEHHFHLPLLTLCRALSQSALQGIPVKGECMDVNLEEFNKESKVWQHGLMNALDWLRIFRNLGKLTKASVITKDDLFCLPWQLFLWR